LRCPSAKGGTRKPESLTPDATPGLQNIPELFFVVGALPPAFDGSLQHTPSVLRGREGREGGKNRKMMGIPGCACGNSCLYLCV